MLNDLTKHELCIFISVDFGYQYYYILFFLNSTNYLILNISEYFILLPIVSSCYNLSIY